MCCVQAFDDFTGGQACVLRQKKGSAIFITLNSLSDFTSAAECSITLYSLIGLAKPHINQYIEALHHNENAPWAIKWVLKPTPYISEFMHHKS